MSVPVIGLCGEKGHGKDTFALLLKKHHPDYIAIGFADKLRRLCSTIFGLSWEQMTVPAKKEQAFEVPIVIDARLEEMSGFLKLKLLPREQVAWSVRELMQYVGTEYVRSVKDSYWVDCVMDTIAGNDKRITPAAAYIITDVRFPNEADAVQQVGGDMVRILRLAKEKTGIGDAHASEAMDFKWDFTLAVVENNFAMMDRVASRQTYGEIFGELAYWDWEEVQKSPTPSDLLHYGNHLHNPLEGVKK